MRHLILILGDQLAFTNPALDGFDPQQDVIVMIEASSEAMTVWSHKARIALFLTAMRHFALEIGARGWPFIYLKLDDALPGDFAIRLGAVIDQHQPQSLRVTEPGELRMLALLQATCTEKFLPLTVHDDTHFLCSHAEFIAWAGGKKELQVALFYPLMQEKYSVLTESAVDYVRSPRPAPIPASLRFMPDAITADVLALVELEFDGHPGSLENFFWPVDRVQALAALDDFINHRLAQFDVEQGAMEIDTPFGCHALLSTSLNLHLLHPREVITAAEDAYRNGKVPRASAERFIWQILGWREFVRGVYWLGMPALKTANRYHHDRPLPRWYWSGDTQMACMKACIEQTIEYGYAQQVQRLTVIGNFALLAGLAPQPVSDWYLAMYVDAVEWVALPNAVGLALHACDGHFSGKLRIAGGADIDRQSNYCAGCKYDPALKAGPQACPFTTLYWDFIDRHQTALASDPRTAALAKSLQFLPQHERDAIRSQAAAMLDGLDQL